MKPADNGICRQIRSAGPEASGPFTASRDSDKGSVLLFDDVGDEISGEAYAVGPSLLAQLDAFEGSEFRRVRVEVNCGGGHRSPFTAWDWE